MRATMRCLLRPALVVLCACGADETPPPVEPKAPSPARPQEHGFLVWKADFPSFGKELHLSPRTNRTYDRSASAALEQVLRNLSGQCTYESWLFSKMFFVRAPKDSRPLLVENLDRAGQDSDRAPIAENTIEAMAAIGDPQFAPSLLRVLEHGKESTQAKAMHALVTCGTADTVRRAGELLDALTLRAQIDWLRAARAHLGDEVVPAFRRLLDSPRHAYLMHQVVNEAMRLPPARRLQVLGPLWSRATGEVKLQVAGALHASGDTRGTLLLREVLRGKDAAAKMLAVEALLGTDLREVLDDVLALTIADDERLRAAAATAIAETPGENVDRTLEVLALDRDETVRQIALRALVRRGVRGHLDRVLETLRTGTGTVLTAAINDVVAARDPRAAPVLEERYRQANDDEKRRWLSALGRMRTKDSFGPLRAAFLGPEKRLGSEARAPTTLEHAAVLLANLDGAEDDLLRLYDELPAADYRRRACLLTTLGNVAATRTVPGLPAKVYERMRAMLYAPREIPQLRLLALEWLRRDLTLEDQQRLKASLPDEPDPAMRVALNDFLFEFF
jgi:HEAT repeat protein